MNTVRRAERLDVLCLEKLLSTVCHRVRPVSDVGLSSIYSTVGNLCHFLCVSIIQMRTCAEVTPTFEP